MLPDASGLKALIFKKAVADICCALASFLQKEKFKEDVNELTFLHSSPCSLSLSLSPQNWQILEGSRGQPLMRGPRAQQDLLTTMMRLESRVVTMRYSFVVKGNT